MVPHSKQAVGHINLDKKDSILTTTEYTVMLLLKRLMGID